jgi:TPR repeat protein
LVKNKDHQPEANLEMQNFLERAAAENHVEASYQLAMLYRQEKLQEQTTDHVPKSDLAASDLLESRYGTDRSRRVVELLQQAVLGGHSLAKFAEPQHPKSNILILVSC